MNPSAADQQRQAERLERALRAALQDLQAATLGRDIATLTVNQQKQKFYQKQIDELLERMKSKSAVDALAAPLTETYMSGFSRKVFSDPNASSNPFGDKINANFSIDTDKLRALTNAVLNPLQGAGDNLHSPLPYIAPNLDPKGVEKMLELSMKAAAQGLSWAELAKEIKDALPGAAKLVQDQLKKGFQVEFPSGYRMPAERYAKVLARTQTVWAGNRGALDRAEAAGSPCMLVNVSPGTCDFCVALEGKVYAITAEAASKYGVPLLSACPNGGPPFHVNCRHALAPFTPRRADAGKLPTAPKELLTHADGKGAANSAQKAYEAILKKDPLPYAKQLAETAARRGFGDDTSKVPAGMGGKPVPDPGKGNVTNFPPDGKSTLSEDVNLQQQNEELRKAGKPEMTRQEYRQVIAQTLRTAKQTGFDDASQLHYYDPKQKYHVVIDPQTGNVVSAKPLPPSEWQTLTKDLTLASLPAAAPTPVRR